MKKSKSGRQIANGIYRELERMYPIKIGKYRDFEVLDRLSMSEHSAIGDAIEVIEDKIATLRKPSRPLKRSERPKRKKLDA